MDYCTYKIFKEIVTMTIKFSDIADDFQEIIFDKNKMSILTKSKQLIPLSYNIEKKYITCI